MDITYGPAKPEDLEEAERVVQQSGNALLVRHGLQPWPAPPSTAFPKFCLAQDPSGLWVAEDGDTIVGFGFSWMTEKFWCLSQLFVRPEAQAKGIGQALLLKTLMQAERNGAANRALITFAYNIASTGLYLKNGLYPREPFYHLASALCGASTSLGELVFFRALQGVAGAGLIPLSQATLLQINPPERHGHAMAVFGIGTIMGPIMGPALGGWLTYDYSRRWVFYINLPVGVLCTLGILVFIRQSRNMHREPFDFVGFLTLSLGIGALQLMLDRGELKDWFHSSEIWIEATVAGLGFYLFTVHTITTEERSFLNRDLLKSANFVAGTLLMFCGGLIMTGTLALVPTMLQNLMEYPALTTGLVTAPRGVGSMVAMQSPIALQVVQPPPSLSALTRGAVTCRVSTARSPPAPRRESQRPS